MRAYYFKTPATAHDRNGNLRVAIGGYSDSGDIYESKEDLIKAFITLVKDVCKDTADIEVNIPEVLSIKVPDYDYYTVQGIPENDDLGVTIDSFKTKKEAEKCVEEMKEYEQIDDYEKVVICGQYFGKGYTDWFNR